MPGPLDNAFYCAEDHKVLEFYIRTAQVDKIKYGDDKEERVNVQQGLTLALTMPMEFLPDPRTIQEDQADA